MDDISALAIRLTAGHLELLDQQRLPHEERWLTIASTDELITAIHDLSVRGAPLIGVAAALWLGELADSGCAPEHWAEDAARVRAVRPTAVNLAWAVDRMLARAEPWQPAVLVAEAAAIFSEDVEQCRLIGEYGADLIQPGETVMTHCNAGGLATAGIGTAIGVLAAAHQRGTPLKVIAGETRPLLQGARLTAWELGRLGIEHEIVCDSAAASLMAAGRVDRVIVGADRIARNGDAANKIGTYGLAVNAAYHGIPFYVAAPQSTVDLEAPDGAAIPIEFRDADEVLGARGSFGEVTWAAPGSRATNPAFDVTPASLIAGWILDTGLIGNADDIPRAATGR